VSVPSVRALAVVATLTLAGTACSTGPASGPAHEVTQAPAAFRTSVERICGRAVTAHGGHAFPVNGFDPLHPQPSQLPAVGRYFARYGQNDLLDSALHSLVAPADEEADWRQVLATVDAIAANTRHQIAAAQARDVSAFVATVRAAQQLAHELGTEGRRLGFTSDSPCGRLLD
jgi:hypothetical protein